MENVIEKVAIVATFLILAAGLVLGEETFREKIDRMKSVAVRWVIYSIFDYALVLASIALVGVMLEIGGGFVENLVAMWAFDITAASVLLYICIKSGKDLTNGQEYRRSFEIINAKSRLAGWISLLILMFKAVTWDGPERMCEFWKEELGLRGKGILIVSIALLQAVLYVIVYTAGFSWESIWPFIQLWISGEKNMQEMILKIWEVIYR